MLTGLWCRHLACDLDQFRWPLQAGSLHHRLWSGSEHCQLIKEVPNYLVTVIVDIQSSSSPNHYSHRSGHSERYQPGCAARGRQLCTTFPVFSCRNRSQGYEQHPPFPTATIGQLRLFMVRGIKYRRLG